MIKTQERIILNGIINCEGVFNIDKPNKLWADVEKFEKKVNDLRLKRTYEIKNNKQEKVIGIGYIECTLDILKLLKEGKDE